MDRSVYNTLTEWGFYSEQSTNSPNFRALVASKAPLPIRYYLFGRNDGYSPISETYAGPRTERNVAGWTEFTDCAYLGHYLLQVGNVPGNQFRSVGDLHGDLGNRLTAAARDAPIDLGVSLGEYRETASMVAGAMRKTVGLYKAVRKHDFSEALRQVTGRNNRKASDAAKAAADAWLGFTYGVKPLMSDVSGAMDLLNRSEEGQEVPVHTVRASNRENAFSSARHPSGNYEGHCQGELRGSAKMQFFVENPLAFTLDQVGLWNPLALGWELIPYSFCVDWFLPIGDLLRGVVPPPGVSQVKGYTYVKGRGSCHRETNISSPPPGWYTKADSKGFVKERKVLTSFPSYYWRVPDLSLSYNQLASAAALMVQQLR